jgi:large subunit ribosomal protein L4
MKLAQIFLTGSGDKSVTVSDAIFGGEVNLDLIAQAVYVYRSNQRTAHATVQRRGEVDATGKKAWKQKGTGRARHGARTAPIFVGGGQAHGPTGEQNYKKTLSASMKLAALRSALAAQAQDKNAVIAQGAEKLKGQTKELSSVFAEFTPKSTSKVLVVIGENENFLRAAKNLPQIQLTRASRVNALEVAQADTIIVLNEALPVLETRLSKKTKKADEPVVAPKAKAPRKAKTTKEA